MLDLLKDFVLRLIKYPNSIHVRSSLNVTKYRYPPFTMGEISSTSEYGLKPLIANVAKEREWGPMLLSHLWKVIG